MSRLCSLALLALAAATPASATDCLLDGVAHDCFYPPYSKASKSGLDAGFVPGPGVPAFRRLHRVTLTGPDSVCNDGSPAVMYVREAQTVADQDKWLIVLEGGGTGFDPTGSLDEGMWNRWTGQGHSPALNWYRKASTDWFDATTGDWGRDGIVDLPDEMAFDGILDGDVSAFADWNLVFLNYCSSDGWAGSASNVSLPDAGSWNVGGRLVEGFKADFHGHDIILDALDMLDDTASWPGTDADASYVMPDLSSATDVLLAGESAGGGGVLNNLDRVEAELASMGASARVGGSIGASHKPSLGVSTDPWWVDEDGDNINDVEEGAIIKWSQVVEISGQIDASCVAGAAIGDEWQCLLLASAAGDISTPFHVKQDMSDSGVGGMYDSQLAFADGLLNDYDAGGVLSGTPHFAPDCNHHASLTSPPFFQHRLKLFEVVGGVPVTPALDSVDYDEALFRFFDPGTPSERIYDGREFTVGGTVYRWVSDCS